MQNNRKKIIFLDGNYSEGGEGDEDVDVVTNATTPASSLCLTPAGVVAGEGQSVVADVGQSRDPNADQSGDVNCKRVPTSENPNPNIVGKRESESESDSEEEGDEREREENKRARVPIDNDDDNDDDESQRGEVLGGGDYDYDLLSEGGRSSIDSASVVSSVATNDLLSVDPLYIRLTKFLETSNKMEGGSTANIADLLYDVSSSLKSIKVSFQEINSTLQKLAVTKASQ